MNNLYDVIAVNIETSEVRFLAQQKILSDAQAIVEMAVLRRGLSEEFYKEVPTGKYQEGEHYGTSLSK